eukprot:10370876-Alexandrium_andersonii.AAC.1
MHAGRRPEPPFRHPAPPRPCGVNSQPAIHPALSLTRSAANNTPAQSLRSREERRSAPDALHQIDSWRGRAEGAEKPAHAAWADT